jgi:PST family polysaccharide transporter
MGDKKLNPLIKTISFSFLIIPFISLIRGFFQGKGNMFPTAVSQVMEQFIRVGSILCLTFILIKKDYSLYAAGEGALIGSIAGGVVSLFVLLCFFFKHKNKISDSFANRTYSYKYIGKTFLIQGLAICISGMLLVLFQLVDSLNIYY